LLGGARVSKSDPRIELIGALDELNAVIGLAVGFLGAGRAHSDAPASVSDLANLLVGLQRDLFELGAEVAVSSAGDLRRFSIPQMSPEKTASVEQAIDRLDVELPPLRNFI